MWEINLDTALIFIASKIWFLCSQIMDNFRNQQYSAGNENSRRFSDVSSQFKRRQFKNWSCLLPRRYILALMLFILLVIQAWRNINILFTLAHVIVLGEESAKVSFKISKHYIFYKFMNNKSTSYIKYEK